MAENAGLTLVVLAAGMGSRFGARIKQLEPLGPHGELLIDYSVYDAKRAGFDRVVFIIRRDIDELFRSTIGDRISARINTEYVYQSPDMLPCRAGDFPSRTKPWGTAQALYCCKDVINGRFAVINADDFYGSDAFLRLAAFLAQPDANGCSVGFLLKNTLSDYGTVNRGICSCGADGMLTDVRETRGIKRCGDGVIRGTFAGVETALSDEDTVSMSMWGFEPGFMDVLSRRLTQFLEGLNSGEEKAELTIADVVGAEIKESGYTVRNLPTESVWFGITYESDTPFARQTLTESTARGIYPGTL